MTIIEFLTIHRPTYIETYDCDQHGEHTEWECVCGKKEEFSSPTGHFRHLEDKAKELL